MKVAKLLPLGFVLLVPLLMGWGQTSSSVPSRNTNKNADSCYVRRVKSLPGSHDFDAEFIEVIASDPSPRNRNVVWGLTADLSNKIPAEERALYISKSTDGGETWTQVARIDSKYFDARIDEGLRNGLSVAPGGAEFVITTQKGAFQVFPRVNASDAMVRYIAGPRVPHERPWISITKKEGDPVRAAAAKMTADGRKLIVGYGYFDMSPQIVSYHKGRGGAWVRDGPLPEIPTDLDILSMQWDKPGKARPDSLYVGTGDQAYRLDLHTMKWTLVRGVEPDSAIHAINTAGGLHLAACWGIYEPVSADVVARVTHAEFVYHRDEDETGPNIRAYGIEVDPSRPSHQVVTALTGVYTSVDGGQNWRRLNDLPEGEYRTAYFNPDGTVIVSGMPGTFLANPFSSGCGPHLRTRN
ncbi:hypothetical protein H7849_10420 [Alloacidobacterium dinghuense]|uniref:Exo-alpha-sialidase n=1 Tax=Alloacidobacterium dinghuense TaxID=2763107 RepID=A0A7G8BRQ6_9BACT|nr:hypothetical protein [Alloacidobacterium dinghuense]QNI35226.1 hypothetical protein H7849_10420 [Alloacidobacterium dinghuense]